MNEEQKGTQDGLPTIQAESTSDSSKNTGMAVLSYLGPLVIISFLSAKEDLFVKFHIKQGFVLLAIEVLIWILSMSLIFLWFIWNIIHAIVLILIIVGIMNAVKGREKELPLIGKFARHFRF